MGHAAREGFREVAQALLPAASTLLSMLVPNLVAAPPPRGAILILWPVWDGPATREIA